jgi:hypothetical protein
MPDRVCRDVFFSNTNPGTPDQPGDAPMDNRSRGSRSTMASSNDYLTWRALDQSGGATDLECDTKNLLEQQ